MVVNAVRLVVVVSQIPRYTTLIELGEGHNKPII